MKLVIFGATGKIGQHLIAQALDQGHEVTAFARNPDKVDLNHKDLRMIKGDVLDSAAVKTAIEGQDVVLCALGMPIFNREKLREKGTKNILAAMKQVGVKRLVCLSVHGVGDSFAMLPPSYKFLVMPLLFRWVIADHKAQEALIKSSGLDWVITRAVNFTDAPFTGNYHHGFNAANKPATLKISQPDLADFMLKQIADNHYLHQTPSIAY